MAFVYWYIRDFFVFCGNVISFVFELIWKLIQIVIAGGDFLISVISSLPLFITIPVTALIIVCILYKILGRESSS